MLTLRGILPDIDSATEQVFYERLAQIEVGMEDFRNALREVEPSAIREVFVEVPNVAWSDIGGLLETKQRLRESVEWPLKLWGAVRAGSPYAAQRNFAGGRAGLRQDSARESLGNREQQIGRAHV
jgi:hypothetical protein